MTDPTASGPNPSGCDLDAIEKRQRIAYLHNEREYFDSESGDLIFDDVPSLIARCRAAEAECARLTAQLAAALEGISDALAGPNAARNCDFRTPTAAEVTETATRLRDRFERACVRMDMAESSLGDIADALGPGRAFMANTGIVASVKSMLSALHDAENTTACVCGHMGTQHVEEEGTGAARECCAEGCKCQQFSNVHMALAAATARAGEAVPKEVVQAAQALAGRIQGRRGAMAGPSFFADIDRLADDLVAALRAGGGR